MGLRINDTAPDFTADSTAGQIRFHDWIGDHYAILFSHPKDFTPVCTDIEKVAGAPANFPIIDDTSLTVSKLYDMLPADAYMPDGRTAADSASVRTVFIVGPDRKVRLTMAYPMSVGRNFAEILRALDAVQATDGMPLATPANWVPGQDVIVALSVSTEDARAKFGDVDVKLPYLRTVKAPA